LTVERRLLWTARMNGTRCFLLPACCIYATVVLSVAPVAAQEPTTTATATAQPALPDAFLAADVGYQSGNHESLTGMVSDFVLGIRVRSASDARRDYLEVGIARLDTSDTDEEISWVLVGARSTWTFGRVGLHLFGHFQHGDAALGDDMETIASHSIAGGVLGSFDLWKGPAYTLALGLHASGTLYDVIDGEDRALGGAGDLGLSFVVW
jgi:hypothetical protein